MKTLGSITALVPDEGAYSVKNTLVACEHTDAIVQFALVVAVCVCITALDL